MFSGLSEARRRWLAGVLLAGLVVTAPGTPRAAEPSSRAGSVEERLRQLEQEVQQLRRERAQEQKQLQQEHIQLQQERKQLQQQQVTTSEEKPVGESDVNRIVDEQLKKQKVLAGWQDGFFLQSPNGDFKLKLRGYVQADLRDFPLNSGDTGNDSFYLRRVRPIVEGTVYKYFDFKIMPDFGLGTTVLQDAYADIRYFPYASLRIGKFKEPFSLERLQSATNLLFVDRAISQNLAPNRDIGAQLWGEDIAGVVNYQLFIGNGDVDSGSNDGSNLGSGFDGVARVFLTPFKSTDFDPLKGLGLGLAGTYGDQGEDDLQSLNFRTAGRSTFFKFINATTPVEKGSHWRFSPQAYEYWGPFGFMGEYITSNYTAGGSVGKAPDLVATTANADSSGWFAQASYVLTGEDASYNGVVPIETFDPANGRWGAFEVAGRVSTISINNDTITSKLAQGTHEAWEYTGGLNWYLNKAMKVQLNWVHTNFNGQPSFSGEGKKSHEDVILTQFQIQY